MPLSCSQRLTYESSLTACIHALTGIAVDKNGLMYFVDATMIRKVDQNGIISTLLGANDLTAVRPLSCDSSMDVSQVRRRGGGAGGRRGEGVMHPDINAQGVLRWDGYVDTCQLGSKCFLGGFFGLFFGGGVGE